MYKNSIQDWIYYRMVIGSGAQDVTLKDLDKIWSSTSAVNFSTIPLQASSVAAGVCVRVCVCVCVVWCV